MRSGLGSSVVSTTGLSERTQAAVAQDRHGRQRYRFLRHVIHGANRDVLENALAAFRVERGAEHALTQAMRPGVAGERRRDDHLVELADDLLAQLGMSKPPGSDIRDAEPAAVERGRERRQKCQ